jgi:hypothetical protein
MRIFFDGIFHRQICLDSLYWYELESSDIGFLKSS